MIIKCECNKTEHDELIKQLKDEGLTYTSTVQTTIDDTEYGIFENSKYFVTFWYSGKLI